MSALDFIGGLFGGGAGVIVGHPLDTVKVRMQTQCPNNIKYKGTFQCISTIIKQESVSGLYKGISSPMFGIAGINALIFGVYGSLLPYVKKHPGNDAIWAHFVAGAVSGAAQSVIASPMELVKIRMQINESANAKAPSSWDVLKQIFQKEGGLRRGVLKGWGVTLAREIPGFGTYFATYEALTNNSNGPVGTFGMMMAGGMAGVTSWLVTYPIDMVKTRLQCDVSGRYSGAFECMKQTYATEGYKAFSRGLASTLIRAFPTNAATFTVVTMFARAFSEQQETDDGRHYLQQLLEETSHLQERLEESVKLQLPHYYATISLSHNCAVTAMKYEKSTVDYLNFRDMVESQWKLKTTTAEEIKTEKGNGSLGEKMLEVYVNQKEETTRPAINNITSNSFLNQDSHAENASSIRQKELSHITGPHPSLETKGTLSTPSSNDPGVFQRNQRFHVFSKMLNIPEYVLELTATSSLPSLIPSVNKIDEEDENENNCEQNIVQRSSQRREIIMGEESSSSSSRALTLRTIVWSWIQNNLSRIALCTCSNDTQCVCFT